MMNSTPVAIYRKEGRVLFNDTLNTFCLWLYNVRLVVKEVFSFNDALNTFCLWLYNVRLVVKDVFYLTTHSTHFVYGYIASDLW